MSQFVYLTINSNTHTQKQIQNKVRKMYNTIKQKLNNYVNYKKFKKKKIRKILYCHIIKYK